MSNTPKTKNFLVETLYREDFTSKTLHLDSTSYNNAKWVLLQKFYN